jgi:hypothetical protein
VPGVLGGPLQEMEKGLDMELDGLLGSGLLAAFRVTLVNRGKTMWLEDMPHESLSDTPPGGGQESGTPPPEPLPDAESPKPPVVPNKVAPTPAK